MERVGERQRQTVRQMDKERKTDADQEEKRLRERKAGIPRYICSCALLQVQCDLLSFAVDLMRLLFVECFMSQQHAKCIPGMDLLEQLCVLPHCHLVTVY